MAARLEPMYMGAGAIVIRVIGGTVADTVRVPEKKDDDEVEDDMCKKQVIQEYVNHHYEI